MFNPDSSINLIALVSIIGGVVLAAVIILLIVFIYKKNKPKIVEENKTVVDDSVWVNALGGKENILNIESKGSRLIVYTKNNDSINKDELHKLGVLSVISSKDKVTLVLKEKSENISNLLK